MVRRAFTMAELMVVVAVIVILLALLAPAGRGAREQGQRVRCQSHMSQLLRASLLYAADNDGQMPFPNWQSKETPGKAGWLYRAPLSGDKTEVTRGVLWPYLGGRS